MTISRIKFLLFLIPFICVGCSGDEDPGISEKIFSYAWEIDNEGWEAGYADYPSNLSLQDSLELYAMSYGHRSLPAEIQPAQKGILLAGANRSDDLFMYLFKKIEGLNPDFTYRADFEIEIASNAPTNAVGIGGAPGESVFLKAGIVEFKPDVVLDNDSWYRMNLDKGNQSVGGTDMVNVGNAGVRDDLKGYELILRKNSVPAQFRPDANGNAWIIIGSDSGFEGLTALYYASLKVAVKKI